jgi:hypothetical protein
MIKETIVLTCLILFVMCSSPSQNTIPQDRDAALLGSWNKTSQEMTFNAGGDYAIKNLLGTAYKTIESGLWHSSYGTLYMETSAKRQYKIEYEIRDSIGTFCLCRANSSAPLDCSVYIKR